MDLLFNVTIEDVDPRRDLGQLGDDLVAAVQEVLGSRGRKGVAEFAHLSVAGEQGMRNALFWTARPGAAAVS
jgi:hypothetical protein